MYRKIYTAPQTEYKGINVMTFMSTISATADNQEGYMGCDCGGDKSKCTCGDGDCDCWGCGDF